MIFYGLFLSVIGFVFTKVLMTDVLFFYKQFLHNKVPAVIAKPLGLCSTCFTGQISLWFSLPLVTWNYVGIISFIGVVSINIIVVLILNKYVETD